MTETTSRYLVLLPDTDEFTDGLAALATVAGITTTASALDVIEASAEELTDLDSINCEQVGVAIVNADPNQAAAIAASVDVTGIPILGIQPEGVYYAVGNNDYVMGYRDGINNLADRLLESAAAEEITAATRFVNSTTAWGLQATNVINSKYSGRGIKLAVLDTELDLAHPDFAGRAISAQSFVRRPSITSPLQKVEDGQGHGTHCAGIAYGPLNPIFSPQPRYGVAYNAELFFAKVLDNSALGRGLAGEIVQGINWALANNCDIISMSLASTVSPGNAPDSFYETTVADRALKKGCLIIAAAGNDSNRSSNKLMAVGYPAASPSIMAVAAIDSSLAIASFSNAGLNTAHSGDQSAMVDIAAPGVNIYSSVPFDDPFPNSKLRHGSPRRYLELNGTSQATPFVAGIAALHAEATGKRGRDLWNVLTSTAKSLGLPARDVGAGLVQAP
ncbi:S8 family serine peptidase [Phormidium tenue FACHB-886]|nr:S8 family serine peptidase [Phormidium tenue FACHB-886]